MGLGICLSKRAGKSQGGRARVKTNPSPVGTAGDEGDQSRHGCSLLLPSSTGFIGQPSPITLICGIKEKSISIREVMCSGLTGPVSRGAVSAAWALPVPGSVSMPGHGWQGRRQPQSYGGFPEYIFFFCGGSTISACPAWKGSHLGLSPVLPRLWLGMRWWLGASRGGCAERGTEILAGDGVQMAACASAIICKTVHLLRCSLLAVRRNPLCCTGQILLPQ